MLSELLATRAALYVAGTMPAADRDVFELVLEFQPELRAEVADLEMGLDPVCASGSELDRIAA